MVNTTVTQPSTSLTAEREMLAALLFVAFLHPPRSDTQKHAGATKLSVCVRVLVYVVCL